MRKRARSRTPSRDAKKRTRKQKTYGLIGDVNTSGSATEAPFPFWTVTVGKAAGIFFFSFFASVFQAKNVAILKSRNHLFINKKGGVLVNIRRGESERRKETSANILHECFYRLFWDEALSSDLLRSAIMDSICVDSLSQRHEGVSFSTSNNAVSSRFSNAAFSLT